MTIPKNPHILQLNFLLLWGWLGMSKLKKFLAAMIAVLVLMPVMAEQYWISESEFSKILISSDNSVDFRKFLCFPRTPVKFTAFCVNDSTYYLWKVSEENNQGEWSLADSNNKAELSEMYRTISSENECSVSSYDNGITQVRIKKLKLNGTEKYQCEKKDDFKKLRFDKDGYYVLNASFGKYAYLIKFRDTKNLEAIEKALSSSTKPSKENVFELFTKYLNDKLSDERKKEYARTFAGELYNTLLQTEINERYSLSPKPFRKNCCLFQNLYTSPFNSNYYIRSYLKLCYEKSFPFLGSYYQGAVPLYDPYGFKTITEDEYGNNIAGSAEKKLNQEKITDTKYNSWSFIKECINESGLSNKTSCIHADKSFGAFSDDDFNEPILKSMSVAVYDLSKVQKGDILVYTKNHINNACIITDVTGARPKEFSDQSGFMKNITVVYYDRISRNFYKATMSDIMKLAERKGMVRRLCTYSESKKDERHHNFDIFDREIRSGELSIGKMKEKTQTSTEKFRWIPNTGEPLCLGKIKFNAYNKAGIRLNEKISNLSFVGAHDRNYDSTKSNRDTYSNIYNNRACVFNVLITNIARTVSVKGKLEAENGASYYIFKPEKENAIINIGKDGMLNIDYSQLEIEITPESNDKCYPGDDLLLEFCIKEGDKEKKFCVKPEDYIAVYDKKLLWRANLYINKSEPRLNGLDWNNAHPWPVPTKDSATEAAAQSVATSSLSAQSTTPTNTPDWWTPEWGYNDWNIGQINGGQVEIKAWTRFNGGDVMDSVAYGYGVGQTVKEFNDGLEELSKAMVKKREADSSYPPSGKVIKGISTAPDGQWGNYIFPAEDKYFKYGNHKLLGKEPSEFFRSGKNDTKVLIPGFSTYWLDKKEGDNNLYDYDQTHYTLGIDCSGLVHRSTCYPDRQSSRYKTKNTTIHNINAAKFMNEYSVAIQGQKWNLNPDITSSTPSSVIEQRDEQRRLLSHAVPGDIFVINDEQLGHHVVFVQDLIYNPDKEIIEDYSQVEVIHSTEKLKDEASTWMVNKGNWRNIQQTVTSYKLHRLIME